MKIKTLAELTSVKECACKLMSARLKGKNSADTNAKEEQIQEGSFKKTILVCGGPGCSASKSDVISSNLKECLKSEGLENEVDVVLTGCFGFCEAGPVIKIMPDNTFYVKVRPEDAEEIVKEHIVKGNKVEHLLYTEPSTGEQVVEDKDTNFYKKQVRIALRNCGLIDPEKIDEYIGLDGYKALATCLTEYSPEKVIEIISASGLSGRGGAGFPTGKKWAASARAKAEQKYIVCNADEGDPGAFMDRSILEGDPHSVLEAMAIAGYAIGATKGLIYIRAEYPLAVHRLQVAIGQAREYGLLGKDIFGTGFEFDIELRLGAGAFVCGEATALIHSMEGKRGEPTFKPPRTSEKGYLGMPTNVNNVETYANVPAIILKGAEWFSSIGTANSKGTKVFALAGQIRNVGLIEVPMGTTLREIVYEIGGGMKDGKKFKAIQTGGPSGGCLTEKHLDIPIDYKSLSEAGSMMGSGGMVIMDESSCMVSVAKFYLDFTVEESCGKCTPCRIGNKRLYEMLDKITKGKGTMEDLEHLRNLSNVIKETALCGLGQSSPNPILSTLDNFWDEFVEHVVDKKCRAGVCKDLIHYEINPSACIGCTNCARNCPVDAIQGERKSPHTIDQEMCIKCGTCVTKCKFNAIRIL
ncbi:MAG: NADH-quinone oxidoreductase subunit NuoF [Bacteroidales bacterium]|nr:NADH-quinone oxidoreductase subunit NuoF [Bacteroidales bacterium]MBQ9311987.1 NADH-quinone oxidoreductase subunit NuoF [Bacteroidales bacterium]